ncbi:hypothetical protein ABE096_23510 [Robertmurraya massiliosenegalensis]|uniref:hypothetical protein n=1 Tax=Robertmurraya TaxID=2837507 RepID=UPI0039A42411
MTEQDTPEPLPTMETDLPHQKYSIMSSSILLEQNAIRSVSGYGYKKEDEEVLTSLVFELDDLYLLVEAGAGLLVQIKMTKESPKELGTLLYTV